MKRVVIQVIDTDEHPRPDSSEEKIAGLRPVFKKEGVVTAANASGICDGAGRYAHVQGGALYIFDSAQQ